MSPPLRGWWKCLLFLKRLSVVLNCGIIDMWRGCLLLNYDLNRDETSTQELWENHAQVHDSHTVGMQHMCEKKQMCCISNFASQHHLIIKLWKFKKTFKHKCYKGNTASLCPDLVRLKRQFVIIADNFVRKWYLPLWAKQGGLRFLRPVLLQSLWQCTSRCPLDLTWQTEE